MNAEDGSVALGELAVDVDGMSIICEAIEAFSVICDITDICLDSICGWLELPYVPLVRMTIWSNML